MNARMQQLLRLPERSARDTDELKRLEAARQKIIATGQSVTLPVSVAMPQPPATSAAPPSRTETHCSDLMTMFAIRSS